MKTIIIVCNITLYRSLYIVVSFFRLVQPSSLLFAALKSSSPQAQIIVPTTAIGHRACSGPVPGWISLDLKFRKWRCEGEGLVQRLQGYPDSLKHFLWTQFLQTCIFWDPALSFSMKSTTSTCPEQKGKLPASTVQPVSRRVLMKEGHFPFAKIFGAVAIWPLWTVSSFIMAFLIFQFDMDLVWFVTNPIWPQCCLTFLLWKNKQHPVVDECWWMLMNKSWWTVVVEQIKKQSTTIENDYQWSIWYLLYAILQ